MKLNKLKFFALACFFVLSCAKTTDPSSTLTLASNVLPMSVNGEQCNFNNTYLNKPCVSVKVCKPGSVSSNDCVTINDLLVDTGSVGLRVFKSVLGSIPLTQVTVNSNNLAECMVYGDGSKQWGPVQTADVYLGGESKVSIPIHVIDSTFTDSGQCGTPAELDTDPTSAGFNGILGVGNKAQDCGSTCESSKPGYYFSCNGSGCNDTTVLLNNQVTHPVANLPVDNNGVILRLPNIGLGGQPSLEGYLVLGIGTQLNNTSSGVTAYPTDSSGNFYTTYGGSQLTGFTDSGTNLLVFPGGASNLPDCGGVYAGYYCPSSTQTLSATVTGIHGVPTIPVPFQMGNFINLANSPNWVFVELGATTFGSLGTVFDFGLPFFIGRNVYVGIENKSALNLGTGPYVAF